MNKSSIFYYRFLVWHKIIRDNNIKTHFLMEELGISRFISHGCGECVENIEQECEDKAAGH